MTDSKKAAKSAGRLLRRCAAGMVILAILASLFVKYSFSQQHQAWVNVQAASQVVAELERLLRGLNEAVVTEGSIASEKLVKDAISSVDALRKQLSPQANESLTTNKWSIVAENSQRFVAKEGVNRDDIKAMIAIGKLTAEVIKMQAQLESEEKRLVAVVERSSKMSDRALVGAALASVLGAALIFWIFHRRIALPLEHASRTAARYAQGDLSLALIPKQGGEVQFLFQSMEVMRQELCQLAEGIRVSSSDVANAARDTRQSNEELSARFQTEAASIEQTASTIKGFAETLAKTASDTQHAQSLTKSSAEATVAAAAVVEETVQMMNGLSVSSKKINSISAIIDEIAMKTNILALNASIEASRSGTAGKGFAVIAQEVGRLAQSCSESAGQIKDLISGAVKSIDRGTALITRVGDSMDKINESYTSIDHLIEAIASRAIDQSSSVEEISAAVAHIDQNSRANLDQVQLLGASASSLEGQAHQLKQRVNRFVLS